VLVICICAFILNIGIYSGFTAYMVAITRATGATPPLTGCNLHSTIKGTYACFLISIIFETIIIFLIVLKSFPIVRLRRVKAPLYSLIFEDGMKFYFAMLLTQILTLVAMISPSMATAPILGSAPPLFVIGVACNRLLLRSQRLLEGRGSDFSSSFTSGGITIELNNQDDSRLANYSAGEGLELAGTRKEIVETEAKTQRIETGGPPMPSLERLAITSEV
jgi:hypothetical protein